MLPLYFKYPDWIHQEVFPGVPFLSYIRWYGLMYVFAFVTAYIILRKLFREGMLNPGPDSLNKKNPTEDDLFSFIATGIIGLLLGARIFSTLIYSTGYWTKPWLIFWPFDSHGNFTGLAGMSYHGGFIGGLLALIIWCRRKKRPLLRWIDAMVTAIPLGYTFGRLGNFLNGELFGRITDSPVGMLFRENSAVSLTKPGAPVEWLHQVADNVGIKIAEGQEYVILPRHPSQLYEAFFEGIVLFLILWFLRKKRPFDGFLAAVYTAGYGLFRFFIEYFRQPDADIGYRIGGNGAVVYENTSLLNISTGQILCFLMILGGLVFILLGWKLSKNKDKPADRK